MIVGRGAIMEDEETKEDVYFDYMGASYPEGMDPENAIFFNEDNVDEVLFTGFIDDEEERFKKLYRDWEASLSIDKKLI